MVGFSLDYWPPGIPDEPTVPAFTQAFATKGFVPCDDGTPEHGYEKIALYALRGEVTHAAIQRENGKWQSKLGEDEDIEHPLDGLEGPFYGSVVAFFKRPIGGDAPRVEPPAGSSRRSSVWQRIRSFLSRLSGSRPS